MIIIYPEVKLLEGYFKLTLDLLNDGSQYHTAILEDLSPLLKERLTIYFDREVGVDRAVDYNVSGVNVVKDASSLVADVVRRFYEENSIKITTHITLEVKRKDFTYTADHLLNYEE